MNTCIFCQGHKISIMRHREVFMKQMAKIEELQFTDEGPSVELLYSYVNDLANHFNYLVDALEPVLRKDT